MFVSQEVDHRSGLPSLFAGPAAKLEWSAETNASVKFHTAVEHIWSAKSLTTDLEDIFPFMSECESSHLHASLTAQHNKLGNASIVGRALDGNGTVAPFSSMETKPCPFEEMSPISGYLPSNAR